MLEAIGSLLPAAAGIALSPFPVVAIVLLLGSTRGVANGLAFATGWTVGLGALTAVVVMATSGAVDASDDAGTIVAWVRIVLGGLLIAIAAKKLLAAIGTSDDAGAASPGWMSKLDDPTPTTALTIGALLGGVNPKNIAFTVGAAPTISTIGLSSGRMVVAAAVFVLLASAVVLTAVAARVLAPRRSESSLAAAEQFMLRHGDAITIGVLVLLGAKILGDGLAGL